MSDFQEKYDELSRKYPAMREHNILALLKSEPMFPVLKLREAWDYYKYHATGVDYAEKFFHWLEKLEKDVPFDQQKYQP